MTRYLKTLVVLVVSLMAAAGDPQDALSQTREVGEVFRDCPRCPEMVVVPSGSFMMGSPASEEGRYRVTIGSPFAVGVHEVQLGEYVHFVSATGHSIGDFCLLLEGPSPGPVGTILREPGYSHPAVCVSWEDARAYVQWLSRETGESYRLLSESEWEYVARAGTQTRYWWGDDIGRNRANCDGCGSRWDNDEPAPVGSFAANGFGLHDVHGNVWEWVQDCWKEGYGAPRDGSARDNCEEPPFPDSGYVVRGGSWVTPAEALSAAHRRGVDVGPNTRFGNHGFRVARTLTP